ncbi:hypothetical protein WOLCODRAFT_25884 [Wolfiporia cocos MD-104 SS10]|uniref:Uncharacterized protein n=1 Tax=Wolfiporia cocos (strain MD-104) TaxID=742152 RepID=A0A2H3JNC0_WOLCO|nr:hypothetical protein WOLCODRAFT_25884 [Wolfiporia cocos MD-104 SS10]
MTNIVRVPVAKRLIHRSKWLPLVPVPQQPYRYGAHVPSRIAVFHVDGRDGIRLGTQHRLQEIELLHRKDDPAFPPQFTSVKATLRIMLPGYTYPCAKQLYARGTGRDHKPKSIGEMVSVIAEHLQAAIERYKDTECTEPHWKVGRHPSLTLDDFVLLDITWVSVGSIQPTLAVVRS